MIPISIYFKNVVYKKIKLAQVNNVYKFLGEGYSEKVIEFDNIKLETNPFCDLISIFKKKKTQFDDKKIHTWILEYGFLNSTPGEVPQKKESDYDYFIKEAKTIVELWIKFNETKNCNNDTERKTLEKWLKAHEDFEGISSSIYTEEFIKNGVYSSGKGTSSFNKPKKDLTYKDYRYAGFKYILYKITSRLKNISFDVKEIIPITDKSDAPKTFYGIENSIIIPPDLLTALYLYFFQTLHSNIKICPICLKPFSNRRSDAVACSPQHSNACKKREQRKPSLALSRLPLQG